jgi:hypothetical protein
MNVDAMPIRKSTPKLRKRWLRVAMIGCLMVTCFMAGSAITAVVAARLLLPVAAAGLTMGMLGLAAATSWSATLNGLQLGDSETRLAILTQLQQALTTQPPQQFDAQSNAMIVSALKQCETDSDPQVVALAGDLIEWIENNTIAAQ